MKAEGGWTKGAEIDARTIYDIACIRGAKDDASREDMEFKAIAERNLNNVFVVTELYEALAAFDRWNYEVKSARVNGESIYSYAELQAMRARAEILTGAALAEARGESATGGME